MVSSVGHPSLKRAAEAGEPAWDVARLFPAQGCWSEEEYLALTDSTNHLVEFTDGHVEVLPMPTTEHQRILMFLIGVLQSFLADHDLGELLCAPLRVKLATRLFREPDLVFMSNRHKTRVADRFWNGADLAIEIVIDDPKSKNRDHVKKCRDYAKGGIAEYWIVDPSTKTVKLLRLHGKSYRVHGEWTDSGILSSPVLQGFRLNTADVWRAAQGKRK